MLKLEIDKIVPLREKPDSRTPRPIITHNTLIKLKVETNTCNVATSLKKVLMWFAPEMSFLVNEEAIHKYNELNIKTLKNTRPNKHTGICPV